MRDEYEPEEQYMRRALELARAAAQRGEVPVGAVVVQKTTGRIVGEGANRRESAKNALAHAEIIAINEACETLGGWRLVDCALYVTLEPCPMCAGAIFQAHAEDLIFGARDEKGGAVVSVDEMYAWGYNWTPRVREGMCAQECREVLQSFFRAMRLK